MKSAQLLIMRDGDRITIEVSGREVTVEASDGALLVARPIGYMDTKIFREPDDSRSMSVQAASIHIYPTS